VRAATVQEIKQTARGLLVEQGPEALTLRAIAREMGMTAPALYRYFDSHEILVRQLVADIFGELTSALRAVADSAAQRPATSGSGSKGTVIIVAVCREFRRWALDHTAEYALLFGTPIRGRRDRLDEITDRPGRTFARVFFGLFTELWRHHQFAVPAPDEIDAGLRDQLERFRDDLSAGLPAIAELPVGAMLIFLRCWTRLYGAVTMEAFGHLKFALDDASAMFEYTLSEMTGWLGMTYPPRQSSAPAG
jgi:AcrR family transcriptional regulator